MERVYSDKQRLLLRLWQQDKLKRINLLEGSVRSGKTFISLVLWALWVGTMPREGNYLMVAKTLTSLRRNCLDLLEQLVGSKHFTYSLSKKEGRLFGRLIYLEGVSDVRAESKIRGMTLQGAYCDELTLFTPDFFAMLLSRLSMAGAKVFATTNPDNPGHWLMEQYISRQGELDMLVLPFFLQDNPFLHQGYIDQLKKEYTGVFYQRFILGQWVAAEGVIYPEFANRTEAFLLDTPPADIAFATIGVDFGGHKSAHAFICNGIRKGMGGMVTLEEFYLQDKISPAELEGHFVAFVRRCRERYPVYDTYCDSAETTLIRGLSAAAAREGLALGVHNARKGAIIDRIRFFNTLLSHGRYHVMGHCTHVIRALQNAVWDDTSLQDRRLDSGTCNVDSLDALEYAAEPYMKDILSILGGRT